MRLANYSPTHNVRLLVMALLKDDAAERGAQKAPQESDLIAGEHTNVYGGKETSTRY